MPENKSRRGNYRGTKAMKAENQDMPFVNDTLENAPETQSVNIQKDDLNEGAEDKHLLEYEDE